MFVDRERFHAGGDLMSNGHYSIPQPSADLNAYYDRLGAELDAPPRQPAATASRLDAIRVLTIHEPFRPLCPRCRRPYNPDAPLMREVRFGGCYHCGPIVLPPSLAALDELLGHGLDATDSRGFDGE